jgi:2-amino-4-hydroxy-6-hydroxymethyldihydropteridine diphosphokinase
LVYFSLGSNINPAIHLKNALENLDEKYGLESASHIYETSPVGGGKNNPNFWNMVAAVETVDNPAEIRRWIAQLEKKEGRKKTKDSNAARTLDVDLILWKSLVLREKVFSLPHPDIGTKAFVLFPLLEIAPGLSLPGSGKPLIELAHAFKAKDQKIHQLKESSPIHL